MAQIFERVLTEGIAELSYLIGDDSEGIAAVIDPLPDVAVYLQLARKHKVSITHVFETHIHADFVSGARELATQSGSAKVYASVEGGAGYGFEIEPVRDSMRFEFGSVVLTARHTPGHTPEHLCYEVSEKGCERPWGVFTGDSLLVGSIGRSNSSGISAGELASQLYDTLFGYFTKLDGGVIIYPAHGSGSLCGTNIGERLESTIGYEKQSNPYLREVERDDFIHDLVSTAPPEPAYYRRMKKVNAQGPLVRGRLPVIPALSPKAFKAALDEKRGVLVDTRSVLAFGGGHIDGALNIGGSPALTIWAGWILDPEEPILLVLERDTEVEYVAQLFVRSGFTRFAGYLAGGMKAWDNLGLSLAHLQQMTVQDVRDWSEKLQIVDVRTPAEWSEGHLPRARHIFVPEIPDKAEELAKDEPTVTYCASGYRASLAASMLQQRGFEDVRTMPGSWSAWKNAGFPVSRDGED